MHRTNSYRVIGRAVLATAAVAITLTGVTFAILQSQQIKLTGNTIQTATANLQISADGVSYANSQAGFTFSNLVPGGSPTPVGGRSFFLKNAGGAPLTLKLALTSPVSNPDNVDLSKVSVIVTPSVGTPQTFSLSALIAAANGGGLSLTSPSQLNPNVAQQFTIQAQMAADAVSGSSATLGNIDLAFTGEAVAN